MPNETRYLGFRHTTGDASRTPWVGAILVPTDSRDLHIASAADENTDWNVANPTHPTLYVHSETTPATDYLSLSHDGTTGAVNSAGGTIALQVSGTAVLTSTASVITLGAVDLVLASGQGIIGGSATQITISDGDGATNLIPEVQVLGVGAAFAGGSILIGTFNTTNTRAVSPKLAFVKGAAATQVATTAVADNEVVGSIIAYGSDSADFETPVAAIEFVVDDSGGPGANAIGGSLEFYTTADGGTTLTEALRITQGQLVAVPDAAAFLVGSLSRVNFGGAVNGAGATAGNFQIQGTGADDEVVCIGAWVGLATSGPSVILMRSAGAIGAQGIVSSGDNLGQFVWCGDDGVDFQSVAALIRTEVDGTPGTGDMPGRLLLMTTADGAQTVTERVRIASTGLVTIAAGTTPASVATTPGTAHAGSITATGGLGGDTSIATTGVGGIGAGFSFTSGAGGTANSATTASTGGAGGAWAVTTGAGGAAAVAGTTATGGAGGAITLTTGVGGAVSLAVSGTATGGAAGLLTIRGGVGGAVIATTGTNVGGAGGGVSIIAGAGGAASGATDTGGAGGIVTMTPGAGGAGDANAAGKPGYISITTSYTRRSVQTIDMADAAVTLTVVPGNPVGTLMTSDVLYVDANSATTENLLLPHEADLTGIILVIVNTGGETINIQNDAGGAVLTLETANTAFVTCDGTTLRGVVGIP